MNQPILASRNPGLTRRGFLAAAGVGATALLAGPGVTQEPPRKLNVLFILADDQRFNTLHALGNPVIETPNLDRLVREGTALTSAYIMGSLNAAVCVPSRAMLITGRGLFHLHDDRAIPPEEVMLPEAFAREGYLTFHAGKWHQSKASFARAFQKADAIHFSGLSGHYAVDIRPFDPNGEYPDSDVEIVRGTHSSELFADAAVNFLRSEDARRPFFANVAFTAPHDPRTAPPEFRQRYRAEDIPLPPNFLPEHPFDNGELKVRDEQLAPWPRTPEVIREHLADYYAMITHLDSQIGRILDTLDETGLAENTVVVFTGDNGDAIGSHGLMGKQNLYEDSIHVPLVFRGPGIPAGETRDALAYLSDIYPTLCELAEVPVPASVEGTSLVPVLEGGTGGQEGLIFAYKNFQRGLRSGPWKLIAYNVGGEQRTQLFNLEDDPYETKDLSSDPDHAAILEELTERERTLARKWGDPADISQPGWGVPEIPAWPAV